MATTNMVKYICDRCGGSIEKTGVALEWYGSDWQHIVLGQTGAELDLCGGCNMQLYNFLKKKGATNMDKAVFNNREVL